MIFGPQIPDCGSIKTAQEGRFAQWGPCAINREVFYKLGVASEMPRWQVASKWPTTLGACHYRRRLSKVAAVHLVSLNKRCSFSIIWSDKGGTKLILVEIINRISLIFELFR